MNSNKMGNPGKIIKKVFVSTVGMVWGTEIVKKKCKKNHKNHNGFFNH